METRRNRKIEGPAVKPATPARVSRTANSAINSASSASRTRKVLEPEVLGRSTPKDPARDRARQLARDQDLKPTRSSAQERLEKQQLEKQDLADQGATQSGQTSKRVPSRSSRSMKSRQSEPRVSRTGSKSGSKSGNKPGNKRSAKTKSKPPFILMALTASLVVIGLILLSRLFAGTGGTGRTAKDVRIPTPQAITTSTTVSSQASTVQDASASGPSRIITAAVNQKVTQKAGMNLTQPRNIQLSQIAGFSNGIPAVIQFRDGSRMNADPVTLEQLPAEVRLQLTYTRERP